MFGDTSDLKPRPAWARYGIAAACLFVGWLGTEALTPRFGETPLPFIFFFPGIAIAAWYGGLGPGAVAMVLSALTADWFFIEPRHSWSFNKPSDFTHIGAFLFSNAFIVGAMEAMHRARARLLVSQGQIRQSEELKRRTLEALPAHIAVLDGEGRIVAINRAWEEFALQNDGAGKQSVAEGANYLEVCRQAAAGGDELAALALSGIERVMTGGQAQFTMEYPCHSPQEQRWFQMTAVRLGPAGEGGAVVTHVNITARRQAEAALRESEERFRALAESMPNLAWWANGDGYITWYNRRWYEFTGTTPAEMEGWGWQKVHDPEILPAVLERWKASIARGEAFEMEFPLRGGDGRFRWFLTRIAPVRDSTGKVARWFGTNTDVTDLREARRVLARDKEQLDALVKERTARLQERVGELEHFSYTITHDMRAPLRAMRAFAEMLNDGGQQGLSEEQRSFVGRIITGAERMDALITDALKYSRVVRSELPVGPVDVERLLLGMLDTYPEFQAAEADIAVERPVPLVLGNEAGLTQCFSNLIGNAVKFVRPGVRAKVRIRAEEVQSPGSKVPGGDGRSEPGDGQSPMAISRDGSGWVRIWVEDDGIGISKEMLPRVFEMFSHGSNPQAGTGIGLALARKVVERMGGKIGVESQVGRGSRFWVELKAGDVKRTAA